MHHRILVPVDGSESSMRALEQALEIARLESLVPELQVQESQVPQLHVVYVVDDALDQSELLAEGNAALAGAVERAREVGITAVPAMRCANGGTIAAAILAEAQTFSADLIVLGTHGRKGLRRAILGSVAEEVIRDSRTPILLPGRPS